MLQEQFLPVLIYASRLLSDKQLQREEQLLTLAGAQQAPTIAIQDCRTNKR